jgi:predicted RNA-binding Zn-ribbon protein involved in translation (DUF1610 family)
MISEESDHMETLIGIGIWVIIFVVWYVRTYPEKFRGMNPLAGIRLKWPRKKTATKPTLRVVPTHDFKTLVETVESICARDKFSYSDAATLVEAIKELMELEPSSGQIWEAYALDSLESAEIICDACKIPVQKTIKKTGVRFSCTKCGNWLALKNSKVTVIDPSRPDLEDWEK